jgi:hypothetical protein
MPDGGHGVQTQPQGSHPTLEKQEIGGLYLSYCCSGQHPNGSLSNRYMYQNLLFHCSAIVAATLALLQYIQENWIVSRRNNEKPGVRRVSPYKTGGFSTNKTRIEKTAIPLFFRQPMSIPLSTVF